MKRLLVVALVLMAALAGCSAQTPTEEASHEEPASVAVSGDAPANLEAFYVTVDGQKYVCIGYEYREGSMEYKAGYAGLSCNPVGGSETTTTPTDDGY